MSTELPAATVGVDTLDADRLDDVEVVGLPTLAQVRAYVSVPVELLPDEDLTRMYVAEIAVQTRACRVPTDELDVVTQWPPSLAQVLLRRVQRQIAGKNLPLGYIDPSGDYGPARVPQYDVMIEELEGRWRRVVFG